MTKESTKIQKAVVTNEHYKNRALQFIKIIKNNEIEDEQTNTAETVSEPVPSGPLELDSQDEVEDEEDAAPPSLMDGPFGFQRPPKSSINTAPKVSSKASKVRSLPAAATVPQKIRTHVRGDALRGPATPQQTRGSPIATGPAVVAHRRLRMCIPNLPLHPKRFRTVGEIAG